MGDIADMHLDSLYDVGEDYESAYDLEDIKELRFNRSKAEADVDAQEDFGGVSIPKRFEHWKCAKCGSKRWCGWRASPVHLDSFNSPRKAQCVPCGHVQELPK